MTKPQLYCIDCGSDWWADDRGGNLFVSEERAKLTALKYADALNRVGYSIRLCDLDEDLAQMSNLYHEGENR